MEKDKARVVNRVEQRWENWLQRHPYPGFESRRYDDRKLEALMRMKKWFERLPEKTKEEMTAMRQLEGNAEKLRKPQHARRLERVFHGSRNPILRFFSAMLEAMRESGNKWRESVGKSPIKPKQQLPQARKPELSQKKPRYRFPDNFFRKKEEPVIRLPRAVKESAELPEVHARGKRRR